MAQPEVEAFVMQRLADQWYRCPVVVMNTTGEAPGDGSPYLLVQYPASNNGMRDIGEYQPAEEGGVRFVLHMYPGEGIQRPSEWGREIGDIFRSVRSGGLKFGAPSSPFFDDSNDEGSYFLCTVVAPYTFDF